MQAAKLSTQSQPYSCTPQSYPWGKKAQVGLCRVSGTSLAQERCAGRTQAASLSLSMGGVSRVLEVHLLDHYLVSGRWNQKSEMGVIMTRSSE